MGLLKRHLILLILLFIILGGLIWSLFHLRSSLQKRSKVTVQIEKKLQSINRLARSKPTDEFLNYLNNKGESLRDIYERMEKKLTTPLTIMPEDVPSEGVVFKGTLSEVKKNLTARAEGIDFSLPGSIGFKEYDEIIPEEEELANLTRQLQVIERLTILMMDAGVNGIESVKFLKPMDIDLPGKSKGIYYRQFPVKISLKCTTASLSKFLYNLSTSEVIFVVRSIVINKVNVEGRGGGIKAELEILDVVFS